MNAIMNGAVTFFRWACSLDFARLATRTEGPHEGALHVRGAEQIELTATHDLSNCSYPCQAAHQMCAGHVCKTKQTARIDRR